MKELLIVCLVGILALTAGCSKKADDPNRVGSAEWVIKAYFLEPNPPDLMPYMADGFAYGPQDPTYGASVPLDVKTTYRVLQADSNNIVYAVTSRYQGDMRDMYCYMNRRDTLWQINTLLFMPAYDQYIQEIAALKAQSPLTDSLKTEIRIREMTIASDSVLTAHFNAHKADFDSMAALCSPFSGLMLLTSRCGDENFATQFDSIYGKVCPSLAAGMVVSVIHGIPEYPAATFFEVGHYLRHGVGYVYVPEGANPPVMSAKRFYLLDKIAPNWYLYKLM
jgi:hypothetical protein